VNDLLPAAELPGTDQASERSYWYAYVFLIAALALALQLYVAILSPLSYADRVLVLVGLATVMAALVVAYDMHLKYEPRWILLIPFGSLALVFVLVAALLASSGSPPP
jgi:heme/copper-type cytochrome/quinol oxidase subunit 4